MPRTHSNRSRTCFFSDLLPCDFEDSGVQPIAPHLGSEKYESSLATLIAPSISWGSLKLHGPIHLHHPTPEPVPAH